MAYPAPGYSVERRLLALVPGAAASPRMTRHAPVTHADMSETVAALSFPVLIPTEAAWISCRNALPIGTSGLELTIRRFALVSQGWNKRISSVPASAPPTANPL
eukprot:CAMPEP_0206134236 /NCGR_PEP_ID=MMETSP1472-20131121/54781_1 /ASSEMBLY_ACC=CAM_ASM_001108 /TAXON_ID=41880 /ORGANISM="Pycnococcus provasolii, Strain RCC251" /LENGTH=103 /DNA_ID=CAMNT_0053525839 /DNA_START=593 /DNA_END=901 /DNA_ORIENTATION=+